MTTKFHSDETMKCFCNHSLYPSRKCTDQDLRNLRCQEGVLSLGGKSILQFNSCQKKFSSNELASMAVDKKLGLNEQSTENDMDQARYR